MMDKVKQHTTYMDEIFNHSEEMLAWLHEPQGKRLFKWLEDRKHHLEKELRNATDMYAVARIQGQLENLDRIIGLPEKLKKSNKNES